MIPLSESLSKSLHNRLQFLGGGNDASRDKLELGREGLLELLHARRVLVNIPYRLFCVGVFPYQVVIANNWVENIPKMLREFRA